MTKQISFFGEEGDEVGTVLGRFLEGLVAKMNSPNAVYQMRDDWS